MQNNKSLSSSTIWYGVGNFLVRSMSFILLPLYSHFISTDEYGNYALLLSFYALAAVIFQSGMQTALMKYYLEDENFERRKTIFSSIINSIGLSGIIFTCIGILFSKNISGLVLGTERYSNLVILLFSALFFDTLGFFGLQLLKTLEKARKVVLYSVISAVINLALNIWFICFYKMGVEGIFLAQVIASIFLLLLLSKDILNEYKPTIEIALIKKATVFVIPIIIGGLLTTAVDFCDRFILNHFADKNLVGIYSFSYKIALVMNVFIISFRTAWIPHALNLYYKSDPADGTDRRQAGLPSPEGTGAQAVYTEVFGNTFKKLIAACLLILLAVTLLSPYLFKVKLFDYNLLDTAYEPGLIILPYVLLGYLFNGAIAFYSLYPYISSRSYHFLISDGLAFVVNMILNFILIPHIGMKGAAVATTLAYLAGGLYLCIISWGKIKISYPVKEIVLLILISGIVFIIGISIRNFVFELSLMVIYTIVIGRIARVKLTNLLRIK